MNKGFNEEKKYTLRIAPMIEIENCAIMSIPIATIPKLDDELFIKGSSGEITLWPLPIAEKTACNTYELLPSSSRWNHVLKNAGASHITCMILPDDIPASILNATKDLIYQIEENRSELSRKQIYTSINHGGSLRTAIQVGYNAQPDARLMMELLGRNSYSEKQANRIKHGRENMTNIGEKKQGKPACLTHEIRNAWNECACKNDVPSLAEVLALIPTNWQSRLLEILHKDPSPENIQYIWKKIQRRLNLGTGNE